MGKQKTSIGIEIQLICYCDGGDPVELMVYDETVKVFRKLNKNNYNDDIICGTIFLKREALSEIGKYFHICGYVLIEKEDGALYPVDIHTDKIVIFEGVYNCMPPSLKHNLLKYNIKTLPDRIWSSFFFQWQFMCDFNAFENHGSFIKLCNNIMGSPKRYKLFVSADIALYEPTTYEKLCSFTRNILELSNVDVYSYDYYKNIKYLIDSLIKGYHITFTDKEITSYFYQISKLVDERWEE